MISLLQRVRWTTVAISLLVFVIIGLVVTVRLQSAHNDTLTETNTRLTQQRDEAQAITQNVITATTLFNDIARATQHDNETSQQQSESRIVVIRQAVSADACAKLPVPDDATQQLRQHRDAIRRGAAGIDTHQSAR